MNKQTNYPKIGIRPIIDGRLGGIRESLEETTMKMAQNVAALYEKELRYPDGSPVQCVIADTCIEAFTKLLNVPKNLKAIM
jgi:L-fucose isomerase